MTIEYSLDKLVMDCRMDSVRLQRLLDKIGGGSGYGSVIKVTSWQSSKIQSFKENLTIGLDDGNSFYLGVMPNWERRSEYTVTARLEFNPNKVRNHPVFRSIHHDLVTGARYIDFKRYDIAVDLDIDRRDIWLKKDKRTYKLYQNSESDKTEYLGQRSEHGQVKLYNKQIEAKLLEPKTRLELTMDYEKSTNEEFKRIWPKVTYSDTGQMNIDDLSMDGTERVLVLACLEHPEYLKMLNSRYMGKKIECILERYTHELKPDCCKYNVIIADIHSFGKSEFEEKELKEYMLLKSFGW